MMYVNNWWTGAVSFVSGSVIWIIITTCRAVSVLSLSNILFAMSNYVLPLWIIPLMFYYTDKKARHGYFLQWKISHVYLSRCELS